MHHRSHTTRRAGFAIRTLLACTLCGGAWATEIKGAEILNHPCGKIAVKAMGLMNQGKVEEANKLSTKSMQDRWAAMPAKDREMMAGMAKAISPTEAEFAAMIKADGVLVVEGAAANLTITKKTQSASGSSTSTTRQQYALSGSECLINR